jgi:ornithine carbamoyltransferase
MTAITATTKTTASTPSDLLRASDLTADQQEQLLELAAAMKSDKRGWVDAFRGETLAMLFDKPSTRTRVSLATAAARLGMTSMSLHQDELQTGRGETVADTGRALSAYVAAITIRTFAHESVVELAEAATVPVVNALTDKHHPCQALADLLTLKAHFGALAGLKVAYVGDGNNVAHSLLEAGALAGMTVAVAAPAQYQPLPEVTASATALAEANGGAIVVTDDLLEAIDGADAVYTDVWISMGDEAERGERLAALAGYQVNVELMALAGKGAIFLHCLPAHREEEVTAEVIDGPTSHVWQQAANRLPTQQALLYSLISGQFGQT